MSNPEDMWQTSKGGCALSSTNIILVQSHDAYKSTDIELGSVRSFSLVRQEKKEEAWLIWFYDNQTLVSCCVWLHQPSSVSLRCVLSEEGQVRLYGPGGKPDRTFQIPDAGVFRDGATGYGYVNRIRAVGENLYVCGAHRQVYRYDVGGRNPLSGQFHDMAGSMRQPPLPKPPREEGPAFSTWADLDIVQFNDIAGTSDFDIYVTGDETWHFDGKQWQQIHLKVTDETMHVIKVLDEDRIFIGGANGYLFMGNVRDGFNDLSSVDDNFTVTGLELFDNKLFIATDQGLYTLSGTRAGDRTLVKYQTDLKPDLQDAHLLEAKDGVLWSFGYKDLAYWDSKEGNAQWTRVHHPNNPRIGAVIARKASRQPPAAVSKSDLSADADAKALALSWLPVAPKQIGQLDIGGLLARVGHSGVGDFIATQLQPFELTAAQVLQVHKSGRYTVSVPKQGVDLLMQYTGPKGKTINAEAKPEYWALAEVVLKTQHADPSSYWRGPWLAGLDPIQPDLLQRARAVFGEEGAAGDLQASFFVDGPHGAAWVVNLEWTGIRQRVRHIKVLNLGGYLPWTG